ncbi:MAG TPA: histidinol-phosphate transaminase [Nitrospirota bacterium]|nr:histidinol-phosphate transaminase [Nitrospirota bacterium]
MRPLTSDSIRNITPYSPGKPVEELERELGITGSIKLASNENPLGPSPKAIAAIGGQLAKLNRYPDGAGFYLKQALSNKFNWPPEGIILGNGSNEILEIIVRTFLLPDEEAIYAEPSFVVYKLASQAAGRTGVAVPLKEGRHDLAAMADRINEKTKLIFVANPNNPTGTMNTAAEMDALMARVPEDVIVVVDEAYHEYAAGPDYPDTMRCLQDGRNVIALRTFSKIYGLAGLRIGYGFAPPALNGFMDRVRQPFNTNSLAQAAALAALGDDEHVKESVRVNEEGKKYLYRELGRIGVKFLPTRANFIYMEMGRDAGEVYAALLKEGVIVRPMGPRQIRVTIGLTRENERFIGALERAIGL